MGPLIVAMFLFGIGCAKNESSSSDPAEAPVTKADAPAETPEELLYGQLRSGSFQLSAAAGSIEDSLVAAQEASKALARFRDLKDAMVEAADFINSAGASVAEFTDEPPEKEVVDKDFAAFDEKRLSAVEAANDALQDLRQALGLLESLSDDPNPEAVKWATGVKSLVAVALDDVWGAIEALGGTPETAIESPAG